MSFSPDTLTHIVRKSWSKDTTSSPDEWDAGLTPARGQCVPTSLVVQDYLGGTLDRLATEFHGTRETHYRNILGDGTVIDISRDQYPVDQQFEPAPVDGDTREYVLENENTRRRYRLLAERVAALLALETAD
ncbi:hypothetical protein IPM09_00200 [Candidatus Saccharibacteria bacterium]|nr:MAG: hypothetical protein IPM09_00200 [Candidatus Saccharibacteria bacterium]